MRWSSLSLIVTVVVRLCIITRGYGLAQPIRINAGGESFSDSNGNDWVADTVDNYLTTGKSYSETGVPVSDTNDQELYQTERWADTSFEYNIPVSNGAYEVHLHFAELYKDSQAIGARVFDVKVEGSTFLENFDIFQEAGGAYKPVVKSDAVTVNDGVLSIEFVLKTAGYPKICGIEVLPLDAEPMASDVEEPKPEFEPIYINAGSEVEDEDGGIVWQTDKYFIGGKTSGTDQSISGTTYSKIYKSERSGDSFQYEIPVPNGSYLMTLHFAEVYGGNNAKGKRVFDVSIENSLVIDSLDIYDTVGQYTATTVDVPVNVNDGAISIDFQAKADYPTISAIEIKASGGTSSSSSSGTEMGTETETHDTQPKPEFEPIFINAGSETEDQDGGIVWQNDKYFTGGNTSGTGQSISGTTYDKIYNTERYGDSFQYEIPVPNGSYLMTLHFAESYEGNNAKGKRVFDVFIENSLVIDSLDIYDTVGRYTATTVDVPVNVNDGAVSIDFQAEINYAKISAIEIKASGGTSSSSSSSSGTETETVTSHIHYAHAVPGGPYFQVDTDQAGEGSIEVNGQFSHTHHPNTKLKRWTWMVDGAIIGSGEVTTIVVPVGQHELILEVEDEAGDVASDVTNVTVQEYGFPYVKEVAPNWGGIDGGEKLTIKGSGFTKDTTVHLGSTKLGGSAITIIDFETIEVQSAPSGESGLVQLSVQTSLGTSNKVPYTFVNPDLPSIQFKSGDVTTNIQGTTLAFGPDGRLYVGTSSGDIVRLTLSDDHKVIDEHTSSVVAESESDPRSIMGIAFNPLDTSENPTVYVTHSWTWNGQDVSYNGKVSAVSGANLDTIKDFITGLPVSDYDHAIFGIEFGDSGELYIQVGGNTNAGIPGAISSREQRDEDALSSATLVAWNVNEPTFDGHITYDDQGNPISGDVEVFAPGQRNSFDIVLHSNGKLYATDNGPNDKYGAASTGCYDQSDWDPTGPDKLNLIVQGGYYGHANRKRGATDDRQCRWRGFDDSSDGFYREAIAKLPSSSDGICEFQTEHFGGQLRGQLIIGHHKGDLRNVKLENDGEATASGKQEHPPTLLNEGGLDVIQGPDGTLFVADYDANKIIFHSPDEAPSAGMKVKSVFPRRGPNSGGSSLSIYGDNLATFGLPTVTVGGQTCSVEYAASNSKIICKLPSGAGSADVVVTAGTQSSVLHGGYRYVNTPPPPSLRRRRRHLL